MTEQPYSLTRLVSKRFMGENKRKEKTNGKRKNLIMQKVVNTVKLKTAIIIKIHWSVSCENNNNIKTLLTATDQLSMRLVYPWKQGVRACLETVVTLENPHKI